MAVDLIFAAEVEQDLDEAYAWYEERRAGLGEEMLSCVDAAIQRIVRTPEAFPFVHLAYRRAVIRRFPYVIFFEFANYTVTIFSVFHTAQDPKKWRSRLR